MKRNLLLAVVLYICQLSYAESAIIDHIVYSLDFDDLTATVLNFQTDTELPCDVKIPGHVRYKNDIYKVTCLKHNYYSKYDYKFSYDYEEARANIEHIELPNTLEEIEKGAFAGMKRLKTLIIPSSVKRFTYVAIWDLLGGGSFETFPRLETIIIQGTPTCELGLGEAEQEVSVASQVEKGDFDYIKMMAYVVARVDSLTNKSELCPNLKTFSMPQAKAAIETAKKNKSLCAFYNAKLEEICTEYNTNLKNNAFYDGTTLTYENIKLSDDIEAMKRPYRQQKESLSNEYNDLMQGKMERNLRKNDKGKFIECYKIAHPEKLSFIDSISLEYSCHYYQESYKLNDFYKLNDIIIDAIDGKRITLTSCREEYYREYAYLFKDRAEYNENYNKAVSYDAFIKVIQERKQAKNKLIDLKLMLNNNPKVNLQGMFSSNDSKIRLYLGYVIYFQSTYYYDEAITTFISSNEKAKKEYEKNGHFFDGQIDFFEAYISLEYKNILKTRKQNSNS